MSLTASPKDPQALRHGTEATIAPEDDALHQGLGPRQLQMIAIGGAIGTGLFGRDGAVACGGSMRADLSIRTGILLMRNWESPKCRRSD